MQLLRMSRPIQPRNGWSVIGACRLLNLELAQKYGPKAWQAHIESVTAAHKRSASAVAVYFLQSYLGSQLQNSPQR